MTTRREIVKDRRVYSIDAGRTVLEAARYMMEHNVGALPVLRNGELAGIFSERDLALAAHPASQALLRARKVPGAPRLR